MHILKTQRLVIRPFIKEDWIDLYDYQSQSDAMKYEPIDNCSESTCKEEAIRRSLDDAYWAVTLRDHNKVIGSVYFSKFQEVTDKSYHLCCSLNNYYQRDNYALEATKAVMKYGFEALKLDRIYPKCHNDDKMSCDLYDQLKLSLESNNKTSILEKPRKIDNNNHVFLQEEWVIH